MNNDVQRYMDGIPKEKRPLFDKLQALVMSLYPDAEVVLSYQIPTYKAKTGWVGLGYWKDGVSVYTNRPQYIAAFKEKHPAIKTGKGSINFKLTDAVPVTALNKVIRQVIEHPKGT